MKKRYAGKNQVFWGFMFVLMLLYRMQEMYLGNTLNIWTQSFMIFAFIMFMVKSVEWDDVFFGACCQGCRPERQGPCNDKQCYCHGNMEMR